MRIFDCFTFCNEQELLKVRCEELQPLGITHILVESGFTFTGNIKSLNYWDFATKNNYNIKPFICQNVPNNGNAWDNEKVQRNYISTVLQELNAQNDDIVILSDVDEIPLMSAIEKYNPEMGITSLLMDTYYYWLNCQDKKQKWDTPKIMTYAVLKESSPNEIRNAGYNNQIPNAGCHFSWLGDVNYAINKLQSFSHQEYNTPKMTIEFMEDKINKGEHFGNEIKFEIIDIDEIPILFIKNNKEQFKHLIKSK